MAHIVAAAAVPSRHVAPMEKDYLILKRASASRPSGEWKDDDFDVLADGVVVGRIFKANATLLARRGPRACRARPLRHRGQKKTAGYRERTTASLMSARSALTSTVKLPMVISTFEPF
jgi:hypothetical protein